MCRRIIFIFARNISYPSVTDGMHVKKNQTRDKWDRNGKTDQSKLGSTLWAKGTYATHVSKCFRENRLCFINLATPKRAQLTVRAAQGSFREKLKSVGKRENCVNFARYACMIVPLPTLTSVVRLIKLLRVQPKTWRYVHAIAIIKLESPLINIISKRTVNLNNGMHEASQFHPSIEEIK